MSGKSQNLKELLRSAHSSHWNENATSTTKNPLKNRNWTFFPLVRYFRIAIWVCLKYFANDCRPPLELKEITAIQSKPLGQRSNWENSISLESHLLLLCSFELPGNDLYCTLLYSNEWKLMPSGGLEREQWY